MKRKSFLSTFLLTLLAPAIEFEKTTKQIAKLKKSKRKKEYQGFSIADLLEHDTNLETQNIGFMTMLDKPKKKQKKMYFTVFGDNYEEVELNLTRLKIRLSNEVDINFHKRGCI